MKHLIHVIIVYVNSIIKTYTTSVHITFQGCILPGIIITLLIGSLITAVPVVIAMSCTTFKSLYMLCIKNAAMDKNLHTHMTLLLLGIHQRRPSKDLADLAFNLYFTDDGIAYLTEYWGHKIHKFDSNNNKLKETSFPGTPTGIHVKNNI